MTTIYSYACRDCVGMETFPGRSYVRTEAEAWRHMELHASLAHQENPTAWSAEDLVYLKGLVNAILIENGNE